MIEIVTEDNQVVPRYVEISEGTRVVFRNTGRNDHNVIPAVEGAFPPITQEQLPSGAVADITFDEAGDYPYYCTLHGTMKHGMNGAIRVVAEK